MKTYNKVLIALGCGVAVGALLTVLFAPDKGSATRQRIADTANDLSKKLKKITSKIGVLTGESKPVAHHHNGKSARVEY